MVALVEEDIEHEDYNYYSYDDGVVVVVVVGVGVEVVVDLEDNEMKDVDNELTTEIVPSVVVVVAEAENLMKMMDLVPLTFVHVLSDQMMTMMVRVWSSRMMMVVEVEVEVVEPNGKEVVVDYLELEVLVSTLIEIDDALLFLLMHLEVQHYQQVQ